MIPHRTVKSLQSEPSPEYGTGREKERERASVKVFKLLVSSSPAMFPSAHTAWSRTFAIGEERS